MSKVNFTSYSRERLGGVVQKRLEAKQPSFKIWGHDEAEFPEYFAAINFGIGDAVCDGPLEYIGHEAVQTDISNLKTALTETSAEEAFIPAVAPGTMSITPMTKAISPR